MSRKQAIGRDLDEIEKMGQRGQCPRCSSTDTEWQGKKLYCQDCYGVVYTKRAAEMIHSDSELSQKMEPAAPAPEAGPSNTELVENSHSENGASPVLDGNIHSPERANVNAVREALETQQEMEVGKPIQQKEEELATEESTGSGKSVEIDAKPGKQIIINIAGKTDAPIGGEDDSKITSGISDINGVAPSFHVGYTFNGKAGVKSFKSAAAGEAFIKGASAKFGKKLAVTEPKPSFRQTPRPYVRPEQEADKYWVPKHQEWMTLSEIEYRKQQDAKPAATAQHASKTAAMDEVTFKVDEAINRRYRDSKKRIVMNALGKGVGIDQLTKQFERAFTPVAQALEAQGVDWRAIAWQAAEATEQEYTDERRDSKLSFLSPEDAKRFRDHNQGSNIALNQDEEGSDKWEPVFPEDARENSSFFKESDSLMDELATELGTHVQDLSRKDVGPRQDGYKPCSAVNVTSTKDGWQCPDCGAFARKGEVLQHNKRKEAGIMKKVYIGKKAGFNFFFPGQVLKEFYPEIQHEIVDHPNASNSPMGLDNPEIVGNGGHGLEGMLDDALGNSSIVEAIELPGDVGELEAHHAADYSSTSPAGGMGIGRDGKPEVLEGVPLRKENDIRGLMFTDEFYGQYEGVPGAMLNMASKTAADGAEKDQFARFLQYVCGEIAATMIGAFKVTYRPLLDKVPGVGEVQLANIENAANTGTLGVTSNASSRVKYLMDKLNDSDVQDAINDAFAQAAVWCKGSRGGYVYEVFIRAESIDTDSMIMKYKFVAGTKE